MMTIHIASPLSSIKAQLIYLFKILAINKKTQFDLIVSDDPTAPSIGIDTNSTFQICEPFINQQFSIERLNDKCLFECANGNPDYIGSAFFFLTSCQEYNHNENNLDHLGRFQYKNSYQSRFGNVKENLVQHCFDKIAAALGIAPSEEKSSFFLSHDIDSVNGAIFEDGLNVLKRGRFDIFFRMLVNVAVSRPDWLNIDQIMKIESDYDCRSTFFWIVNKGGSAALKNADYRFQSPAIQRHFKDTGKNGFVNGIHKSLSDETFSDEIKKYGSMPLANRYHYLKFNLPKGFDSVEQSGLKLDASLGFSEQMGFRNSYGLPFNPFDFQNNKPYSFVEVPLHVMDRTFFNKRMDVRIIEKEILDFFERNKFNCVLSVLWHNNFFTNFKYKGYLSLYKNILSYIRDNNLASIGPEEIIKQHRISWP